MEIKKKYLKKIKSNFPVTVPVFERKICFPNKRLQIPVVLELLYFIRITKVFY